MNPSKGNEKMETLDRMSTLFGRDEEAEKAAKAEAMARVKELFAKPQAMPIPLPDSGRPLNLASVFEKYGVVAGDHMFFVLDTSGGMELIVLEKVFPELVDAFKALSLTKLSVIMFDSQITFSQTYDINTIEALRHEHPRGGGGTLFAPVCDLVRVLYDGAGDAKVFVLTDGYFSDAFDPTGLDITLIARAEWNRNKLGEFYDLRTKQKIEHSFKQVVI